MYLPMGTTKEQLEKQVIGTGPYRVESYRRGEELSIRRNPDYWGPRPAIEKATIRLNRSPDRALEEMVSGVSGFVQSNSLNALRATERRSGVTVAEIPSIAVKCLLFDVASEKTPLVKGGRNPFRDRRVREAIHLGIDRGKLVNGLPVPANPAVQLVPPFIFGFNNSLKPPQPDPARARGLLAQAGFPTGSR